ncbi:hypothetical protein SETIT_8G000500v2 [Setaria italica]|uniref:LRAT domain-containing protein n=1 Tax=Setaria italica TaxID=4555 RepID=K3ZJK7_SETIT|nr:uncharacterized protein LOC101777534 [Setaria italica]RCV36664.1 hypothetical protein SETIT_8G000500v2 [Setaria italica]
MPAGLLSNRVDREDLAAGDHIYSWRAAYLYAHHGIYVGDEMVIHFTRAAGHEIGTGTFLDSFLFSSSTSSAVAGDPPCQRQRCGHLVRPDDGVVMSCLDCFLHGGGLYLFHYAVSPALFLAKARGGTCTLAASDPGHVVVHRARYLLDKGFGAYSLFKNNCEDFAIYCKTGLLVETAFSVGRSGQLASLTAAFSAVASSPLRFLTTSAPGLAIVTTGMYCAGRYVSDMGVRRDVVKVPVQTLVAQATPAATEEAACSLTNHPL